MSGLSEPIAIQMIMDERNRPQLTRVQPYTNGDSNYETVHFININSNDSSILFHMK